MIRQRITDDATTTPFLLMISGLVPYEKADLLTKGDRAFAAVFVVIPEFNFVFRADR